MVTVILMMVPLTIPRLFGIRIYGVMTGSMTPAYPVGGVVYVKGMEAESIQVGDVITYRMGTDTEYFMTHRVVEMADGFFRTKGDANEAADPEPVSYERLIGRVVFYLPGYAKVADFVDSTTGKCTFIILFATAFVMWIAADLLSHGKKEDKAVQEESQNKAGGKSKGRAKGGFMVQAAGAILIVGAVIYLGSIFFHYKQASGEYDALEAEVFKNAQALPGESGEAGKEADALTGEEKEILAGIARLQEENPEVIGWIQFDHLELSYPVMQGTDNEYYLKHTFSGEENSAGSIFMEAANSANFNDSHTILYGHNMRNQSMFGSLKKYKTEDFYKGNEYFTIYTNDHVYRYEIFAYYDISMYSEIYQIGFGADESFQELIDTMKRHSYLDTGVDVTMTDKVLTLSTCSTTGNRFVVNAKRISEKSAPQD